MKYKWYLSGAALLILVLSTFLTNTQAQSSNNGLSVHPSNFDLTVNPGDTQQETVTLDNLTNQTMTISAKAFNFTAQGEEGGVSLTQEATNYSLASWITITPKTVTLLPHQSQNFSYSITVPAAAEPGGHFGSIVFQTVPNANVNGTGAILSQRVGSLVLLRVPGPVTEDAVTESFTTDKQFYEFGPVQFTMRVRNQGNVHIQPIGEIAVKGWLGQHYDIPLDQYNVLPDAIRQIPITLNKKLLIGEYTATMIVSYGDKNQPLYGSTTFYAFPVRYGLIVLIVLFMLFLVRKRLRKAMKALFTGK